YRRRLRHSVLGREGSRPLACQSLFWGNHHEPRAFVLSWSLVFALVISALAHADEQDRKTLSYNVSTSESWAAGMALGQASMARKRGYGWLYS
ncbi:MAG: hypothetical protein WBG92_14190, partial [Thiohalocapsa sp.]